MELIKYNSRKKFLEENLEILLEQEARNEVLIGIVLQHKEEKVDNWLLGRIENGDKIEIIFGVDDDKNGLLMYLPDNKLNKQALELLFDNIVRLNIKLDEVVVISEYAEMVREVCLEKINREITKSSLAYIYKLEKLKEDNIKLNDDKKIIKLENNDKYLSQMIPIVKEIFVDTYKQEPCSDEEAERLAKIYLKKGTYILTDSNEEKIYTQVVNVRNQVNGATIGAVITPREFRSKGYGKIGITAICNKILENKDFISLHVSPRNEAALALYKKIGFEKNTEIVIIKFA